MAASVIREGGYQPTRDRAAVGPGPLTQARLFHPDLLPETIVYYVILDGSGNLVASFDQLAEARRALEQMVRDEPKAAEHLALLTYNDSGEPVGEAITISAHPSAR